MSALSRIASGEHKAVKLKKGDTVILSSTPIPGNEKTVSNVVNKLFEKGAEVIYSDIADIHVSGHACQEELKLLHSLIKPKFFMPVHGEYRHLVQHARLAESLGMKKENIFVLNNGDILNVNTRKAFVEKDQVEADAILVDGLGVGDVGNIVLRDRKLLSESGLMIVVAAIERESHLVVSGPDIISRGFVYVRENEKLMDEARKVAIQALKRCQDKNITDWNAMKSQVRDSLSSFIYETTSAARSFCRSSSKCSASCAEPAGPVSGGAGAKRNQQRTPLRSAAARGISSARCGENGRNFLSSAAVRTIPAPFSCLACA